MLFKYRISWLFRIYTYWWEFVIIVVVLNVNMLWYYCMGEFMLLFSFGY